MQDKEKIRKLKVLGMHLFGLAIIIVLLCGMRMGRPVVNAYKSEQTELKPTKVTGFNQVEQTYEYDVSKVDKSKNSLIFFTGHQEIHVYADGKIIFSVERGKDIFSSTTGPRWDYVDMPVNAKKVKIVLNAVYKSVPMKSFQMYVGNSRAHIMGILRESFPSALVDFLISVVGAVLIVFWIIERKNAKNQRTILYFGFFVLFMGLWCFNETEFMTVIIGNRCGGSFFSFVMLMLIPIPYVKYLTTFISTGTKRFEHTIVNVSVINTCVCIILHLAGIVSVKETGLTEQILLVSSAIYHIWTMIVYYRQKGMDRLLVTNLIGTMGIIVSGFFDLIHYYTSMRKNPVIAHFGLLFSVAFLGVAALLEAKKNIDDVKSMKMYKEIALKDLQTGLFNRNAYDRLVYSETNFTNSAIVAFDINNLKKCNDTLGHEAGDRLIDNASNLIVSKFGKYGNIYRIGGDEFCMVFSYKNENDVVTKVNEFRESQSLSPDPDPEKVSIACGYAFFNPATDKNIEDTRKRADHILYVDKNNMKKRMDSNDKVPVR